MTLLDTLFAQGVRALREPRAAAADVIALAPPREALVPAMLLVTVISVLINAGAEAVAPTPLGRIPHFQLTVFLLVLFVSFAFAVCKTGQVLGGIGTCSDSLLLAVFFQAIFVPAQVLQVFLMVVSPFLASLLALFLFGFGIWVNLNFIAALHGFSTLGKAVGVMLLASVVVALIMAIVAPIIGINLFGGMSGV